MIATGWKPSETKPIIKEIPVAVPDRSSIDRATSLYYMMIGSLATITQTAIKDLLDVLAQRRDLFRHKLKYRIKEAYSRSETLMGVFKRRTSTIAQYNLWLDITDSMEEDLKIDVQRLYYTTDNILLKYKVEEHELQSLAVVAYNLSIMLHDLSLRYGEVMEGLGIGKTNARPDESFLNPMYGMYSSMREVAEMLIRDKDAEYFKEGGLIYRALNIIALKVCSLDKIDRAADDGLKLNGVDFYGEDNQDNSFTEWNAVQVNLLAKNYAEMTDEELARTLGRSVGSIRAKARRLQLTRK